MSIATTEAEAALARMAPHYPSQKPLEYFLAHARSLATQLAELNAGAAVIEPGNASRYVLVVTDLRRLPIPDHEGTFLVSIPNFNPPRVAVFGEYVDEYDVERHLNLLSGDSPYVAIVLSALFEAVR